MTDDSGTAASVRPLPEKQAILQRWLAGRMPAARDVTIIAIAPTGGLSHEILNLDVTWREDGRHHHQGMMVRLDPINYRKRQFSNLRREYDVLSILAERGDVPVPDAYWFEGDTGLLGSAFYAMQRIKGRTPADQPPYQTAGWLHDLDPDDRRQVWRSAVTTMARIHAAPVSAFKVLRRDPASERDDFHQHFVYWRSSFDWAMAGQANPVADAAWEWLLNNPPANRPAGLAWGDSRYVNFMFQGLSCNAVLDWEDVSLSSPLFDLGRWFLTQRLHDIWGLPHLEGLGTREQTLALWEACSGHSAADLRWYEIFSAVAAIGIAARTMSLQATSPSGRAAPVNFTTSVLDTILEQLMNG